MIRKAQIKFICITMSILLGVFSVIFLSVYYLSYHQNDLSIEKTLEDTAASFFIAGEEGLIHSNSVIAEIKPTQNNGYVYEIWFDDTAFTNEQANRIVKTALNRVYSSGKVGNVYYKTFTDNDNITLLVATDATEAMIYLRTTTVNAFFILFSILIILFFIVTALSKSVFKPIEDAFNKQKQFISNASHELKTPISVISANADVLLEDDKDNKWINNIKSQTSRMGVLVEDMLSLAKIDEGKVKIKTEKFNLSDEVNETALPFDAVAFEKKKELEIDILPDLIYVGDRQSVKQIVNILLDNAIKHSTDNGTVKIELKKENGKIILSVFNTGSDIPTENANKIFERFYRGDQSRSRESGGSGLGLSIAKSIADANKWKISASSSFGESMTITVIL
ncbi:MAG: GHKL domain-containing protein [Clostridia bacterium]|nr:GHKL domain-containing protein [Clostridia bacterium]